MNVTKLACCTPLVMMMSYLTACSSGGSSSGPSDDVNSDDNESAGGSVTAASTGSAYLPTGDEPNTVGLQLARSGDGSLHASYADIGGNVFYGRCDGNCESPDAWQSIEIADVDIDFGGYVVPRLELDSQDRPRIVFHAVPGSFDAGNTHYAECNVDCLNTANWRSEAVLGHGGNLLEFRLVNTDWFALDPDGTVVISYLVQNGLVDTDKHLRLLSCESACTSNASWSERIIATYPFALGRPVSIAIGAEGRMYLTTDIQGISADTAALTWFGCVSDCLDDGAWTDGVALQTLQTDLDSLPDLSLTTAPGGRPAIAAFDDADRSSLTLHYCSGDCSTQTGWVQQDVGESIDLPGGVYGAGYGVDARFDGDALELVFAAKSADSPLRQLVVATRCEQDCASAAGTWESRVLARTDRTEAGQGICLFIGTRISSSISAVPGAVGFTSEPQWACGTDPVLVISPDGERYYDNAADVRFFELSTVAVTE